jgi:hypothetical protein
VGGLFQSECVTTRSQEKVAETYVIGPGIMTILTNVNMLQQNRKDRQIIA